MIIDFHTHCFPDFLAFKAMKQLAQRSGILHPFHDGTVKGLVSRQKQAGVDISVILNIATNASQQKNVNDFAISLLNAEGVIPFASIFPDSPDVFEELVRLKESGIRGIKLHPDYQGFFADDEKMIPIYEIIGQLGFITVFHCGIDMGYPNPIHCNAERLSAVLDCFGGAPVVAAHLGGICDCENVMKYLAGKNIFLDTAYCVGTQPPACVRDIISSHGADKILFATDMPWCSPEETIQMIKNLGLDTCDEEAILSNNASRLLGLE